MNFFGVKHVESGPSHKHVTNVIRTVVVQLLTRADSSQVPKDAPSPHMILTALVWKKNPIEVKAQTLTEML